MYRTSARSHSHGNMVPSEWWQQHSVHSRFGGASTGPSGPAVLMSSQLQSTGNAALSGSAWACHRRQIPGPPPWNSHGSRLFFSLHVTRNKCRSSQGTLDRHGLISPDGSPGRHTNHAAPPAPRYRLSPLTIRPEVASQITRIAPRTAVYKAPPYAMLQLFHGFYFVFSSAKLLKHLNHRNLRWLNEWFFFLSSWPLFSHFVRI